MRVRTGPSGLETAPFYCALLAAVVTALCARCAPDAASTNVPHAADRFPPDKVLSGSEQRRVENAINDTAHGQRANPLIAAPDGYRWSDVPAALRSAAGQLFMGVSSVKSTDEEVVATLQMADGQQGQAVVTRAKQGVQARASIGVLGDPALETRFVAAFQRALEHMGKVRRPS